MTDFKLEQKDLKGMVKFFKKARTTDSKMLVSKTLDSQAYATRKKNMNILGRNLIVRNDRFFKSSFRVNPAKRFGDPRSNFSEAGSIGRDRFSGWEEQQTGQAAAKSRIATGAARTSPQNVMMGKARLKPSGTPMTIRDIKSTADNRQRTRELFRRSKTSRRTFLVTRRDRGKVRINRRMEPGLYGWKGKKLLRLQRFGKQYKPTRIDWMGKSLKAVEREASFFDVFQNEFKRMARKRGIKI
jgi:hypothetical protein